MPKQPSGSQGAENEAFVHSASPSPASGFRSDRMRANRDAVRLAGMLGFGFSLLLLSRRSFGA
jgi:hypothetical protein